MNLRFLCHGILISLSLGTLLAEPRTWTSSDGRKIDAELISYDATEQKVTIRMEDGREFNLTLDRLSEGDQAFLKAHEAKVVQQMEAARARAGTTESHSSDGPEAVSYHVAYPESYDPASPSPLLILFSAGGRGKGILDSFKDAAGKAGWVAVGCDGFKNKMDEDLGRRMFTEVLPHIEATVDHDPESLYMGGMSGGAWRAYHYSAWFERPWKGIAACGGWLGGDDYFGLDYPKGMAVAMINGNDDKGANSWVDRDRKVLKERGCEVRVFNFPGGHVIGPPELLLEALRWMDEQRKAAESSSAE